LEITGRREGAKICRQDHPSRLRVLLFNPSSAPHKGEPSGAWRATIPVVVSIPRAHVATVLLVLVVLAAAGAGCAASASHHPALVDDAGSGSSSGGTGATISCQGIQKIDVTPSASSVSISYPSGTMSAQQQLKATATYANGSTKDVTGGVGWSVGPGTEGAAPGGAFDSLAPGHYAVTAACGSVNGAATVDVKLTGTFVGSGVTQAGLDGKPSGSGLTIAYPIDGALFPSQLAPVAFQLVPTSSTQTVGRVAFEGDLIDLKVYEPCVPIPGAAVAGACSLTMPADLEANLEDVSEAKTLTETVRLAAPDGTALAETPSISVRWSTSRLSGGLYYWSAQAPSEGGKNLIMRYDLDTPGAPPQQYYSDTDTATLESQTQYYQPCFGCHAISQDGTKIAITYDGSAGAKFALLDVATKKVLTNGTDKSIRISDGDAPGFVAANGFATLTTFSPDAMSMVQEFRGQLLLRAADATLTNQGSPLFASMFDPMGEKVTEPFWSPKGDLFAFASWVPNASGYTYDNGDLNGDEIVGGEIWTAPVNGTTFGKPTVLVARGSNVTEHRPAISDDDTLVVFDESSCSGPPTPSIDGYGAGPCDGYDDPSAKLRLVDATGGAAVDLAAANGGDTWTNSWPRFSPTHGTFQNKSLYWVAFSSRRPYGATLAGSNTGSSKPQLWFAGVAVDPSGALSGDPSFAPIWMPQQNATSTPRGNHVPQWVNKAVVLQ
jgi:hypothetical protein